MLSKLLKMLMNFKKVQNQTNNEATINQKVNGNLKKRKQVQLRWTNPSRVNILSNFSNIFKHQI